MMSPISVLLAPAVWLSARLSFSRKLLGAFLLFALPLAAAVALMAAQGWRAVDQLRQQRAGLAMQLRAAISERSRLRLFDDEVRKLADRTRQSTTEIERTIGDIEAGIAEMAEENHDTAQRTSTSVAGLNLLSQELRQAVEGLRI